MGDKLLQKYVDLAESPPQSMMPPLAASQPLASTELPFSLSAVPLFPSSTKEAQKEPEVQQLLARVPVEKMSEDELKLIKFNSKGKPRYGDDDHETEPATGVVSKEQFDRACDALDQLQAAKDIDGGADALEGAFEAKEERDQKILRARRKAAAARLLLPHVPERHIETLGKQLQDLNDIQSKHRVREVRREVVLGPRQPDNKFLLQRKERTSLPSHLRQELMANRSSAVTTQHTLGNKQLTVINPLAETAHPLSRPGSKTKNGKTRDPYLFAATSLIKASREETQDALDKYKESTSARGVLSSAVQDMKKLGQEMRTNTWETLKDKTEVGGDLVSVGATTGDKSVWKSEVKDLESILGSKVEGGAKALTAEASANAKVGISTSGLKAEAQAVAKANLAEMNYEWTKDILEFTLANEALGARIYVMVKGMVGAEAKVALQANLQRGIIDTRSGEAPEPNLERLMAGTGMKLDKNTGEAKSLEAGVSASGEVFAGAKLTVGFGSALEWKKKHHTAYSNQLKAAFERFDPRFKVVPADRLLSVLEFLFEWGTPGTVPLVAFEASGTGSAGIGAKAIAEAGWKGGRLTARMSANATFGLGLGGELQATLNLVDGLKFILLGGYEYLPWATNLVKEKLSGWLDSYSQYLSSDDKVLERIQSQGVGKTTLNQRVQMVEALLSGVVMLDEERAILEILRYSKQQGDLSSILGIVGIDTILRSLTFSRETEARMLMGLR